MSNVRKFYDFIKRDDKYELYIYGAIVDGVDKWDDTDVCFTDVKNKLQEMPDNSTLDMYVNSPGGSVFATEAMVAMLERAKSRGITINAWIDGIAASCGSWIIMVADNIYVYEHSIMMIHSPMTSTNMSNAKELAKEIEVLDKIQEDVIIPLYLKRAKEGVTADQLRDMMEAETWLSSEEISNLFDVQVIESERKVVASMKDTNLFNQYRNTPKSVLELLNKSSEVNSVKTEEIKEVLNEEEVVETVETEIVEEVVEEVTETETAAETEEVAEEVEETAEVETEVVAEEVEEVAEKTEEVAEEVVETAEVEEVVDEREVKISNLEAKVVELEDQLKVANEKAIALSDKIAEMQPLVDKYNAEMAAKVKAENEAKLTEKKNYYKNKFEQLGARAKFESEEVQNLLNKCVEDEKSLSKLNLMVVELISVDNKAITTPAGIENSFEVENLIETEDICSKYGFV